MAPLYDEPNKFVQFAAPQMADYSNIADLSLVKDPVGPVHLNEEVEYSLDLRVARQLLRVADVMSNTPPPLGKMFLECTF